MPHDSANKSRTIAATWVALILSGLSLYFTFSEPFDGSGRAYALRVLSPLTVLLLGVVLVQHRRGRRT